jgi:hypothetical protein
MNGRSADTSIATLLAEVGARIAEPEFEQAATLPPHLWVQDAATFKDATYRWLGGIVDVLKRHDAYGIAIENYRAVHPGSSRVDAEKKFLNELAHAMFDPVPPTSTTSADTSARTAGGFNGADAYRWRRVMAVLKRSGAYAAAISHFQIYRVQRLAQACADWTKFLRARRMDDAMIERFLPERPRLMSWEQAETIVTDLLLSAGHPRYLSRHLDGSS